jgi:hypothetical protein
MLWRENLVMYDRETDSWWAQASGVAIRGTMAGQQLVPVPSTMVTWQEWRRQHPETLVLRKSGWGVSDSYRGCHQSGALGVTGRLRRERRPDPKTLVLGFRLDSGGYAVRLDALADRPVILHTAPEGQVIVGASADRSGGRVFHAGSHAFRLAEQGTRLVDSATGSAWNAGSGRALSGPLKGAALEEIPANLAYWSAWRAFFPDPEWLIQP